MHSSEKQLYEMLKRQVDLGIQEAELKVERAKIECEQARIQLDLMRDTAAKLRGSR